MGIQILEEIASIYPGQLGAGLHRLNSSRKAAAALRAGIFVNYASETTVAAPAAAASVTEGFGGVSVYLVDRIANSDGKEYSADDYVQVCEEGFIAVFTEEAVADGEKAYVRITAKDANTTLGAFRNDADGDAAETLNLTNASTANRNITIEIDGESFVIATGASGNADTIAGLIAAAIDASAAFAAAATGAVVAVTRADGGSPGATSLVLPSGVTSAYGSDSDPATAVLLPGARFYGSWSAGAALVRLK